MMYFLLGLLVGLMLITAGAMGYLVALAGRAYRAATKVRGPKPPA